MSALARYRTLRAAGTSRHRAAGKVAASVGCALETVLVWAGDRRGHRPKEARSTPDTSARARLGARDEREKNPEPDAAAGPCRMDTQRGGTVWNERSKR